MPEGRCTGTQAVPTLTLQDVADLANVQRAVVSMWRNRPMVRGRFLPFPDPIATAGGLERFSRDEIVGWLRDTGRGNNGEAALDAPALSVPAGAPLEDLVTLLCLRTHSGEELSGTTPEERDDLARGIDPHDEFMLREVRAAEGGAGALEFVDELVEAAFGGGDALARLERGRLGR
ncbi:MAG: hypothetical protein GEV09_21990, partial [Pseudonocardiaceae bacterium]|nr:hypothetical protein [Pseudonocardiaceae bacterium]